MHIVSQMLLGLGFFFVGMRWVKENLNHLSSRGFRLAIARFTNNSFLSSTLGLVFGMVMQSATAVVFILTSMVDSNVISVRRALPVVSWTNVGLTALAFVVSFNIHPIIAYLIGIAGVALAFLKRPNAQSILGVVLGIGLIFYGLQTVGEGAAPLKDYPWFKQALDYTVRSGLIAFLVGVLLSLAIQSNTAATLVVIALANAGTLDFNEGSMLIYGTNLGTIVLRLLLSAGLSVSARKLVRFEDLFCLISGVLMVSIYYLEHWAHLPLIKFAAERLFPGELDFQLAFAFLISNLLPALLLTPFYGPMQKLLDKLWPAGDDEIDGSLKYLTPQSLSDPETALDLVRMEHSRLLHRIAGYPAIALDSSSDQVLRVEKLHRVYVSLSTQLTEFLTDLADERIPHSTVHRVTHSQGVQSLIGYIEESVRELITTLIQASDSMEDKGPSREILQALQEILDKSVFAVRTGNEQALLELRRTCRSKGNLVQRIHKSVIKAETRANQDTASLAVLNLAGEFELIVWMMHRLVKGISDSDHLSALTPPASKEVPQQADGDTVESPAEEPGGEGDAAPAETYSDDEGG